MELLCVGETWRAVVKPNEQVLNKAASYTDKSWHEQGIEKRELPKKAENYLASVMC